MTGDDDTDESTSGGQHRPPLRLVRGDATPEELAALLTVLSAVSGAEPEPSTRHTSQWASRERALRRPVTAGRGGWRASALPR